MNQFINDQINELESGVMFISAIYTCLSISDAKILITTNHIESNKVPFTVTGYYTLMKICGILRYVNYFLKYASERK